MQIFLNILAVIGIILLCIIGLVLFLVALVLFVPVRYRVSAQKSTDITADVRITWLLHLVSFRYIYPEPGELDLKVLGIRINLDKDEEVKTDEPEKKEEIKSEPEKETEKDVSQIEEKVETKNAEEIKSEGVPETQTETETTNEQVNEKAESPDAESKEEKTSNWKKIEFKIKSVYDKIKKIVKDIRYYWEILQRKENRLLLERCKNRLFKILKNIRPKVIDADVTVGTGSPDTTGYILAVYGMLSPLYGYRINIIPDFDNPIFEGTVLVKGRITIFVLLYYCARIYFDKQMQALIEILKRKED